MTQVSSFFDFAAVYGGASEREFLALVPAPHLYFPNLPELEATRDFSTLRIDPRARPPEVGSCGIVAVAKDRAANAFSLMVTLGRAANNDLVVPDQRVSKFHGYFQAAQEQWFFTDAGSTNGTRLQGIRLAPRVAVPLASGSTLELSGAIQACFLLPRDLYVFLQRARVRAQP